MSVFVEFTYSGIFMVWVWNILCRLMYLVPRCCFFCQVVGPVGPEGVEIHSGPPLCPLTCHLVHIDGNMLMGSGGSPAWILTVNMATAMPRIPVPQSHRNGSLLPQVSSEEWHVCSSPTCFYKWLGSVWREKNIQTSTQLLPRWLQPDAVPLETARLYIINTPSFQITEWCPPSERA